MINIKRFVKQKTFICTMLSQHIHSEASKIFDHAIKSVQPQHMMQKAIKISPPFLQIESQKFLLNHNVYLVGFGKAVLGMASAVENILGSHLASGIISVPTGIQSSFKSSPLSPKIKVFKGALNNLPDENAILAATKISEFVSSLNESQLLLVLISGGGSALLPAPKPPLTLQEKQKVISLLASKGATIEEINTIRKGLSTLKGGGLALVAKQAQIVSLILSDIIGDPLNLIASGPTVKNTDDPSLSIAIIDKYSLKSQIPSTALHILENLPKTENQMNNDDFNHVFNFIIGNNQTALNAAAMKAESLGYISVILSSELRGIANEVGSLLIHLTNAVLEHNKNVVDQIIKELELPQSATEKLEKVSLDLNEKGGKYCLLLGGETTVKVVGHGTGGRNQELALAAAIELKEHKFGNSITLLSAGTDGIDGPTTAAGAIATSLVVSSAEMEGIDALKYLKENDSYTFFSLVENGKWHVKTGHTGTNVMDIIIILVEK